LPPARRPDPRRSAAKYRRPAAVVPRPSLAQFVILSILLHALFILLFGSPAGGSREGRALWGSLDVTIRGPLPDPRLGLGAGRDGARVLPGEEMLQGRDRERREAAEPPTPRATHRVPDLEAPREPDTPVPAVEWTPRPVPEPAPPPPVELRAPVSVPIVPATPIEESATPAASPRLEPAVELAPRIAPPPPIAAPAMQAPVVPAPVVPAPVEIPVITAPPVRRVPVPVIAAPPMQHAPAAPMAAPELAPPVEIAPAARPASPAAAPQPAAAPRDAPPAAERTVPERPVAREPAPRDAPAPGAGPPAFDTRKAPAAEPPDARAAPRIDLDAARSRAREMGREGTGNRALLPFPMPPAPERKTKEQLAIEKAWKPDCKDAYKDMGLLAVIPLVANEFGEGNCRW
jgi:hypothetical protein